MYLVDLVAVNLVSCRLKNNGWVCVLDYVL